MSPAYFLCDFEGRMTVFVPVYYGCFLQHPNQKCSLLTSILLSSELISDEPAFYVGHFTITDADQVKDTFLSMDGWSKGVAFINSFNLGRYWLVRISLPCLL